MTGFTDYPSKSEQNAAATRRRDAALRPKVDRSIFNYGPAIGGPKGNAEYDATVIYTQALGACYIKMSAAAWKMEMALKMVRDACDPQEQAAALDAMRVAFHEVDRDLETIAAGPVKFYRYGRIGNVLRHFTPRWPR